MFLPPGGSMRQAQLRQAGAALSPIVGNLSETHPACLGYPPL